MRSNSRALAVFEIAPDLARRHVDAPASVRSGKLGAARLARWLAVVAQQIAVECERNARRHADRVLERRVAARIVAGVEVGEAIEHVVVVGRIIEQMRDAEVHAAAAREHLVADRAVDRIGIRLRLGVRSANAMLTCIGPPVRTGLRLGEKRACPSAPCR